MAETLETPIAGVIVAVALDRLDKWRFAEACSVLPAA